MVPSADERHKITGRGENPPIHGTYELIHDYNFHRGLDPLILYDLSLLTLANDLHGDVRVLLIAKAVAEERTSTTTHSSLEGVVEKLKILRGLAPITIPQLRRLVSHL